MIRGIAFALALVCASGASALDLNVSTPAGGVHVGVGGGGVNAGVHTPAASAGVHVGPVQSPQTPSPVPPNKPAEPDDDQTGRIREMLGNLTAIELDRFRVSCITILKNPDAFPDDYVTTCKIAVEILTAPK